MTYVIHLREHLEYGRNSIIDRNNSIKQFIINIIIFDCVVWLV